MYNFIEAEKQLPISHHKLYQWRRAGIKDDTVKKAKDWYQHPSHRPYPYDGDWYRKNKP